MKTSRAANTLSKRCRKKLTKKTSWYKVKDGDEETEAEKARASGGPRDRAQKRKRK